MILTTRELTKENLKDVATCGHCGEICDRQLIEYQEYFFCCDGCKQVFQLLQKNDLGQYYNYEATPGQTIVQKKSKLFSYLDDPSIEAQLLDFTNGDLSKVTFSIPQIHCSSCIWLLENLFKLKKGISQSQVNFLKKEVSITFFPKEISLRGIVEVLNSLGYEPDLQLGSQGNKENRHSQKHRSFTKIGIAGFCFGNIMFFSFPEYLAFGEPITPALKTFFELLNFLFALPLFFYCGSDYYISAYKGLKQKVINMDLPITLGITTLFIRSVVDFFARTGPGYFDSLAGLIFFLLIGKIFQQRTFDSLSFDRDYQSYFPLSISLLTERGETTVPVKTLKKNNVIRIRNSELIPADAHLISKRCEIDYSFVTGESTPIYKEKGDPIFAGGRLIGKAAEFKVLKRVSQSYLTSLWNNEVFNKGQSIGLTSLSNSIAKYFTPLVILLALGAGTYWGINDGYKGMDVFSAVLIIACPCALALSTPFTLGTTLRIFGKNRLYLKDASIVEELATLDTLVFDKTGTLTESGNSKVEFEGNLSAQQRRYVKTLTNQSVHPLSRSIYRFLKETKPTLLTEFHEFTGKGLQGVAEGHEILLGKLSWIRSYNIHVQEGGDKANQRNKDTAVHLVIDGEYLGAFRMSPAYRSGISDLLLKLKEKFDLALLSGDQDQEKGRLATFFENKTRMHFNQSPEDKLNYILSLAKKGTRTLMVGDGLNDSGALKASTVGIAVSEDLTSFSPACDGILGSESFNKLESLLKLARYSKKIIIFSFILSITYNLLGLSFAVQGYLSPLISAILMPISSTSVVMFTTGAVYLSAKRLNL